MCSSLGPVPSVHLLLADVPFLCHFRRAIDVVDTLPFGEIAQFLAAYRTSADAVFRTLSYFGGVSFAACANARASFSVALADTVCSPSTVFAAYNNYIGPKEITVYPYNNHEGGGLAHRESQVEFLRSVWTGGT